MFSIARTNFAARLSCVALSRSVSVILLSVVLAAHAFAQESPISHTGSVTPLSELLAEAEKNNPQIEAARQGWQAAKQVPTQVSTLPDPQFNLQHVSVGSPRPFAGYTNSDFAYVGLGVSQDIPYPGKLRLKGEIARRDADVSQQQIESVRRAVLAEIKGTYFQLAYLSRTLTLLEEDGELLKQVEQAADARYRSGMGTQQDVLQAQLQKTKLIVSGAGSGTRSRPQGFQQRPHAGLFCSQPQGAGEAEVSQGGGERDGGGLLLDEFSEFFGGAQIGLMDDAGFTVDAGAFDEVVVEAVAFFLFDEASHQG